MTTLSQLTPVDDQFRGASKTEIQNIEKLLGSSLPKDYVEFLERYGKSTFSGEATVAVEGNRPLGVFVLFAAGGEHCSVLADLQAHEDYLREKVVPVGDDLFNNRYLMNPASGEVFFVEYPHGTNSAVKVSSSFSDFINSIQVSADAL